MKHAGPASSLLVVAAMVACDLPPGFNEVEPDEGDRREAGTADISPLPRGGTWETDFVGWQFGGDVNCSGLQGGAVGNTVGGAIGRVNAGQVGGTGGAGGTPVDPNQAGEFLPVVVEIWDGLEDPCSQDLEDGDRVVRVSLSDSVAGTYQVVDQCLGLTAAVVFGQFRGGAFFTQRAIEGTVTILGVEGLLSDDPEDDVIEGAFTVRFSGESGFTSGGFRAAPGCF